MGSWHRLDLGSGTDVYPARTQIMKAFTARMFARGDAPPGTGVFSRYDLSTDNVQVYFTPDLSDLAEQFHATPCDKPLLTAGRIGLLCGNALSLALHFPDQRVH